MPSTSKVVKHMKAQPKSLFDALFAIFFGTGFRPSDMDFLSTLSWDNPRQLLWSRSSKGFPTGRNNLIPGIILPHLTFLATNFPNGYWWHKTTASAKDLVQHFRCILADDPLRPPQVTLRAARRWYATHLWNLGAPSAYLMRQLAHKWWSTTQHYIITSDGSLPPWRAECFVQEENKIWFHPSVFTMVFQDPHALQQWLNTWRASFSVRPSPDGGSDSDISEDP